MLPRRWVDSRRLTRRPLAKRMLARAALAPEAALVESIQRLSIVEVERNSMLHAALASRDSTRCDAYNLFQPCSFVVELILVQIVDHRDEMRRRLALDLKSPGKAAIAAGISSDPPRSARTTSPSSHRRTTSSIHRPTGLIARNHRRTVRSRHVSIRVRLCSCCVVLIVTRFKFLNFRNRSSTSCTRRRNCICCRSTICFVANKRIFGN